MKYILYTLFICLLFNGINAQEVSVLTQRMDNQRTSWNSAETVLNTTTVDSTHFGLIFARKVDDQIYAQPLIVPHVTINGSIHTVVYVCTVNNSVYAFDAEDSANTAPLWSISVTSTGGRVPKNSDMTGACGGNYQDFSGSMGIVGTPVIDTNTHSMYFVSRDITSGGFTGSYNQYLHSIDIRTGKEKTGSPVKITATYPGNGDGSRNGTISFDPQKNNQRPALLLYNGIVYIGWSSHCDWGPYHGWVLGYDTASLTQKIKYNDTPDGGDGGIWMSATGPLIGYDSCMYFSVGNGTVGNNGNVNSPRDRGESLMKLRIMNDSLHVVDFYTPSDYQYLENNDLDYGVDGLLLIPNTTLCLSGSKLGKMYLVDTRHMGKCTPKDDSLIEVLDANHQSLQLADRHIHGTPVYYHWVNNSVDSEYVYVWAESDSLYQYFFNRAGGYFDTTKTIKGTRKLDQGMPGAMIAVSSNGLLPGTGIIWTNYPYSGDANQGLRPGELEAFDARNVKHILWNTELHAKRDSIGLFAKFNTPVVANGRVYMATFSKTLNVYGILPVKKTNTGIRQVPGILNEIVLSPNPTEQNFTVGYSLTKSLNNLSLTVMDLTGRVIMTLPLNAQAGTYKQRVSLPAQLSSGVYEVSFYSDNTVLNTTKLVKY